MVPVPQNQTGTPCERPGLSPLSYDHKKNGQRCYRGVDNVREMRVSPDPAPPANLDFVCITTYRLVVNV